MTTPRVDIEFMDGSQESYIGVAYINSSRVMEINNNSKTVVWIPLTSIKLYKEHK